MNYKQELAFLKKVEDSANPQNERRILSDVEILNLKNAYPNIPQDYLEYLKKIGIGSFRECQFNVTGHLVSLEDLGLEELYKLKNEIKFFGDNYSGDFSGFDFSNDDGLVVEFWYEDGTIYETNKTFKEYIRERMLIDENEEDTRVR